MTTDFFGKPISVYTSQECNEDGFTFDLDQLNKHWIKGGLSPLQYVTTNLMNKGYFQETCKNGVPRGQELKDNRCANCEVFVKHHGEKLACVTEEKLNIPNMLDLITQALRIFKKKPTDDWFVSGIIELPSGQKQKVYIAQNETGRYTVMLPEDY
jgi:hypothetical protein